MPSDWYHLQWVVTLEDVRFKIKMRANLENLHGLQIYEGVAEVAQAAFGEKGKTTKKTLAPKTGDEAIAMFNSMIGGAASG